MNALTLTSYVSLHHLRQSAPKNGAGAAASEECASKSLVAALVKCHSRHDAVASDVPAQCCLSFFGLVAVPREAGYCVWYSCVEKQDDDKTSGKWFLSARLAPNKPKSLRNRHRGRFALYLSVPSTLVSLSLAPAVALSLQELSVSPGPLSQRSNKGTSYLGMNYYYLVGGLTEIGQRVQFHLAAFLPKDGVHEGRGAWLNKRNDELVAVDMEAIVGHDWRERWEEGGRW
ncbi:hypothetical protein C8J56DRAFT_897857 [Mycena floridula]|nr:hypothetical protein C8J56DRAFT_897857 [Mycena floridula]